MSENNNELESFRRKWREEVSAKNKSSKGKVQKPPPSQPSSAAQSSSRSLFGPSAPPSTQHTITDRATNDDDFSHSRRFDDLEERIGAINLDGDAEHGSGSRTPQEPQSALEHYEKAVEKETDGSLGDSLNHYRKAFRLDPKVDQAYRNKHFPPSYFAKNRKPVIPADPDEPKEDGKISTEVRQPLTTQQLIESAATCGIPPAEPLVEGTPPPPCPIAYIPSEVLLEILHYVATTDPASLSSLSRVCKTFAHHVSTEQSLWRQLCQRHEFGFPAMHYEFDCDIVGRPLHRLEAPPRQSPFADPTYVPSEPFNWRQVFHKFPRIRFSGVYISTVNYTRSGAAASVNHVVWNSPVHIVTYYRYLRFYRDGTCISLLTTTEPVEVVPYLWKENLNPIKSSTNTGKRGKSARNTEPSEPEFKYAPAFGSLAASTIKRAFRGRWRLQRASAPDNNPSTKGPHVAKDSTPAGPPSDRSQPSSAPAPSQPPTDPLVPPETDIIIETEGVDPKYTYTMMLSFASTGRASAPTGPKNNKLVWKGFWYYNSLADDWAEFGLKNDKPFVFSRVGRYGLGY